MTFREKLALWWAKANYAGLKGGAVAAKAFAGAASGHALAPAIGATVAVPTLSQGLCVFGFAFAWHFFDYIENTPPPIFTGDTLPNKIGSADGPAAAHADSAPRSPGLPIVLLLGAFIFTGCESYRKCPVTPDGFNYTLSRDRQTGDLTDYVGFTWNLKP